VATVATVTNKTVRNAQKVITWYERPGRRYAHGRLIIIIGDELFHYGELPYDDIPISVFKSNAIPGQFYGKSYIEGLIPLQRAYNGMLNTVHDYAKRIAVSNILVEEGSIPDYNEFLQSVYTPGAPIEYKTGYQPPRDMQPADFPAVIYNHLSAIVSDMERTAGVSQMQVYGHQSGVTSGKAIENLAEIDNTRLSLTGDNLRDCIKDLSKIWLSIYKKHATGYRTLRIVGGNDAGDALIWNTEDINSYDVYFDAENELIRSTDAQAQNFMNALNAGLLTNGDGSISEEVKERGRQLLKVNISEFDVSVYELQRQRANRENKLGRSGIPPVIMEDEMDTVREYIGRAKDKGAIYALIGNLSHVELAKESGLIPLGDFRLNVTNRDALSVWRGIGIGDVVLSPELTSRQARGIGGRAIVYGRIPLMLTERCFIKESIGCQQCEKAVLRDRKGISFPLVREYPHRNLLLNSTLTYMGDRKDELLSAGIRRWDFLFTIESPSECRAILDAFVSGKALPFATRRLPRSY
jgi:hypothetical protein